MLRGDGFTQRCMSGTCSKLGTPSQAIQERRAVVELYCKPYLPAYSKIEQGTILICILQCLSALQHAGGACADPLAQGEFDVVKRQTCINDRGGPFWMNNFIRLALESSVLFGSFRSSMAATIASSVARARTHVTYMTACRAQSTGCLKSCHCPDDLRGLRLQQGHCEGSRIL